MSSVRTLFKTGCRGVLATGGCKCFTNVMTQTYSTAAGKHLVQYFRRPHIKDVYNTKLCAMQQQCLCSQSGRTDSQAALITIKEAHTDMALVLPVYAEHAVHLLQADVERRKDRALRDPDYDSHLGLERDPISREIINTASHT